jgi:hypothetical protein
MNSLVMDAATASMLRAYGESWRGESSCVEQFEGAGRFKGLELGPLRVG